VHNLNFLKGVAFMQTFKLLSNDSVLLSQPKLIEEFGRAGAQLLSQLHYWLSKKETLGCNNKGVRWIYNSADAWSEQLCISPRQIQRIVKKLTDIGILLVEKLSVNKYNRTNHFTINYQTLEQYIGSNVLKPAENSITTKSRNAIRQNDAMYIQKLPNKDFNKSDEFSKNFEVLGKVSSNLSNSLQTFEKPQVKQVKNLQLKPKKVLEAKILAVVNVEEVLQISASPSTPNNSVTSINKAVVSPSELAVKTSTVQDMLKIWNDSFAGRAETKLSKDLAAMLVAAFKSKFANNIVNWQNYCEQLRSSEYLMADAFKLTIGWALKFSTIDRIRAGELGVKLNTTEGGVKDNSVRFDDIQINQMIEVLTESNQAKELRHKIAQAVGHAVYFSWFHSAKFCEEGGEISMIAPNPFVEQYWETHFEWVIKH
jgi:hypothetical protein